MGIVMTQEQLIWIIALLGSSAVPLRSIPAAAPPKGHKTQRQAMARPATESGCRKAVQEFYDWYLPRLMKEVHVTAMEQAFRIRPQSFSPELRKALAEDLAAAKKHPDEIVSLDFEPFVNSQDPAAKYVAKKVAREAKGYRVEVHAVIEGKPSERPDVIAEVVRQGSHWTFVNFHYPSSDDKEPGTDLLKLLRQFKEDRRKGR